MTLVPSSSSEPMSPLSPPLPLPFPSSVSLVRREQKGPFDLDVVGTLPKDLQGHSFYVGPGGFIDSRRLGDSELINPSEGGTSLFNGDPLLHRFDFLRDETTGDCIGVRLTSRMPRTPCFYTDQACLDEKVWRKYRYFNSGLARLSINPIAVDDCCPVLGLGFRNEINTAVVPLRFQAEEGYRILLTWDAGRPFEIDPESMEIATAIGRDSEWKELLKLPVPFGIVSTPAHPAFAPAETTKDRKAQLFTINYGKSLITAMVLRLEGAPFEYEKWPEIIKKWTRLGRRLRFISRIARWPIASLKILLKIPGIGLLIRAFGFLALSLVRLALSLLDNFGRETLLWLQDISKPPLDGRGEILGFGPRNVVHNILRLINGFLFKRHEENRARRRSINGIDGERVHSLDNVFDYFKGLAKAASGLRENVLTMSDFVHLISWDGESGRLQKWDVILEDGSSPRIMHTMHQIGVTEDYIVLMDTVFKIGLEQLLSTLSSRYEYIDRFVRWAFDFRQGDNTYLYIIKRSDLLDDEPLMNEASSADSPSRKVLAKQVVLPRGTAHFNLDYKNPNHCIRLHCVHNTGWDASEWVRECDDSLPSSRFPGVVGMTTGGTDINIMAKYLINAEKCTIEKERFAEDHGQDVTWMLALNSICQTDGVTPPDHIQHIFWNGWGCHGDLLPAFIKGLYKDVPNRQFTIEEAIKVAREGLPATLVHLETDTMKIVDSYAFPAGRFGNSVQFIPRAAASAGGADGYLMCIVNGGDDPEISEFWIFDAQSLAQGPLCRLSHKQVKIGMTIHSTWVPKIQPRTAGYRISVREDYDEKLQRIGLEKELKPLFENHVFPHFEPPF